MFDGVEEAEKLKVALGAVKGLVGPEILYLDPGFEVFVAE
jgi:hypothetical protein